MALKTLNDNIRKSKAKKKTAKKVAAKKPEIDVAAIEKAVERGAKKGIESAKPQKITFTARKPISYHATIERSRGVMTGARIDPIESGK